MLRAGLALYLLFTTVAGPWVCCCSGASNSPAVASPKQAVPVIHCCACCAQKLPVQAANEHPATLGRTCHCQDDRPLVVLSITEKETAQLALDVLCVPDLGNTATSLHGILLSTYGDVCPFSGCRDLLTTLHILRC